MDTNVDQRSSVHLQCENQKIAGGFQKVVKQIYPFWFGIQRNRNTFLDLPQDIERFRFMIFSVLFQIFIFSCYLVFRRLWVYSVNTFIYWLQLSRIERFGSRTKNTGKGIGRRHQYGSQKSVPVVLPSHLRFFDNTWQFLWSLSTMMLKDTVVKVPSLLSHTFLFRHILAQSTCPSFRAHRTPFKDCTIPPSTFHYEKSVEVST